MIPLFNAVLAAILGSGGSAAPAQHSRIPVITYGANALAQAGGATATNEKAMKNSGKFAKAEVKKAGTKSEVKAQKVITGKSPAKAQSSPKKIVDK
jgi:hypothetical protein